MTNKPRRRKALSNVGGPVETAGEAELARVAAEALGDLQRRDPEALTHGFHAYPARMHPAIAARVIEAWSAPGARVLDPFCGSGTVLVEAMVAGCKGVGVDLNPLALRVAEVKCDLRGVQARAHFEELLGGIAERSEARVRARTPARAPLSREEARWYEPHVLKELAGLREEILAVEGARDRRALEVLLSAVVVKFSKQRADTAERTAPKRIRKGLATEFFHRKGQELVERWSALEQEAVQGATPPNLLEGDARRLPQLLPAGMRADLVLTSPPYGGTYDYAQHHARRFPWLGLDVKKLSQDEIGARRRLRGDRASKRWDRELRESLEAIAAVLGASGYAVMLLGDAQLGGRRMEADAQIRRLAKDVDLRVRAVASQQRPDWTGSDPRREHLIVLGH